LNLSWNCGWEGDIGAPPDVLILRKRQVKNFFCLLMLANGTPMFCAGDEFMHTQTGNNNPYNQNNETTWLDWDKLRTNGDVFRFFKHMIAFRKRHPGLCRSRFWREDVNWYGVVGATDRGILSHTLAFCLHGASQNDVDVYVMINAYWQDLDFQIQEGSPEAWRRVVDTALAGPNDICEPGRETAIAGVHYTVAARSIVVLQRGAHTAERPSAIVV
jgi:glycogen operon protein